MDGQSQPENVLDMTAARLGEAWRRKGLAFT